MARIYRRGLLAIMSAIGAATLMLAAPANAVLPTSADVTCTDGQCKVRADSGGTAAQGSNKNPSRAQPVGNSSGQDTLTRFDISRALTPGACLIFTRTDIACLAAIAAGIQVPGAPAAGGAAVVAVTPEQVAQMAVSLLTPGLPEVYSSPETDAQVGRVGTETFGLVGMPVWLWSEDLEGSEATATAGPFTVTATATLNRVVYDMGDGDGFTCYPNSDGSVGTVYQDSFGIEESPTCGYAGYQKTSRKEPNKKYTISATATWDVTWEGADAGATTLTTTDTGQLPIGEAQAIITKYGS